MAENMRRSRKYMVMLICAEVIMVLLFLLSIASSYYFLILLTPDAMDVYGSVITVGMCGYGVFVLRKRRLQRRGR